MKIEMLDSDFNVLETVIEVHICIGDGSCDANAVCEDCGHEANPENPVYVWTSEIGIDYFVCGSDLSKDEYARLVEEVQAETNPETGEAVFPWTTRSGQPVRSDGTVER